MWHIIDPVCGGTWIDYLGEERPLPEETTERAIRQGLLRHTDGRLAFMEEIARCDSCGREPITRNEGFLHPDRFVRADEPA